MALSEKHLSFYSFVIITKCFKTELFELLISISEDGNVRGLESLGHCGQPCNHHHIHPRDRHSLLQTSASKPDDFSNSKTYSEREKKQQRSEWPVRGSGLQQSIRR